MSDQLFDCKLKGKCDSFYKEAFLNRKDFIELLEKENKKLKEIIDKAIELLGEYRHYSVPDEKQNNDNEDLINKTFDILKEADK